MSQVEPLHLMAHLLDHMPENLLLLQQDGRLVLCNQHAATLFGYRSADEMAGASLLDMIVPAMREVLLQTLSDVPTAAKAEPVLVQLAALRRGGAEMQLMFKITACPYQKISYYKVEVQNLTRSQSQGFVASIAQRLHPALLDSANFAIIATCSRGLIQVFNRCASEWLGYAPHELINQSTPMIFHPHDELREHAQAVATEMGSSMEVGFDAFIAKARVSGVYESDSTYVARDGRRFPVRLSVTTVRDQDGEILGYLTIASDMTHSKIIESALEENRRLTQLILDNLPVAVFTKDMRPGQEGALLYTNPASTLMMGMPAEEMIGKTEFDLFPQEQAEAYRDADRAVMASRQVLEIPEETLPTPNRGIRYIQTTKVPIYAADGSDQYLLGVCMDVTVLHETAWRLREQELRLEQDRQRLIRQAVSGHEP